jgi:hypothetical protein
MHWKSRIIFNNPLGKSDRLLGATLQGGYGYTLDTIHSIEQMDISEADKAMIFEGNVRQLLRLTI